MSWVNFSIAQATVWWQKVCKSSGIWSCFEGRSFPAFCEALHKSQMLYDFGFGVGRVTNYLPGHSCRVHGFFWSPDVFRRMTDVKLALNDLVEDGKLVRVETVVPSSMKSLHRLLSGFGFEREGTLRKVYKVDDNYYDGELYSLIGGPNG